jgi:outer membrane protein
MANQFENQKLTMKLKHIIPFILFGFFVANTSLAQQNWTLNQCISFAIENNINLKEFDILNKISTENLNQSKRELLPGISASSDAGISYGRSIDPITNGYVNTEFFNNSYSLGTSITVFDGFRLQNQIKYEKFRKQVSEYNRLNAIDDLAFKIMTSFFDVIYYEGMLEIAKEQVEASKLNLKTTEKQVEVGLKAQTDLLEMRANLEREELNRIQIENSRKTSLLQLKQQMNFVSAEEMNLVDYSGSVVTENVADPLALFNQYTTWSPYYQSFEANLKATEKNLSLSRSQLYPSIAARGSINTGFSETNKNESGDVIGFGDQFKNNKRQYLGASLYIPVFSRWSNRSGVTKAKLEVERAQTILDSEKQKLFFEMANDLTDLESLNKEYDQAEKRKEVDNLAYKAAEKKLEQGLITVIEFYIAKNRLANTNSDVLRARLQWEIKRKTIEFYKGVRFWEAAPSDSP